MKRDLVNKGKEKNNVCGKAQLFIFCDCFDTVYILLLC